jgi:hypothetical protein
MREAHEEDVDEVLAYTSEGGYTLQAYSEYSLSDNDERCGSMRPHETLPELFTDDSGSESDEEQERDEERRPQSRQSKHHGLFGTCDEWPAEEFFDNNDMDKLAKEMAQHIIWQQNTTEVEDFLFAVGDRNVLSTRESTHKQRNVFLRRSSKARPRPKRTKEENFCLTAYVDINGHQAFALFDSGCTTDTCSPDFARISEMKAFPIESEITLQLGTAGSRSKINYGVQAPVKFGSLRSEEYFDVVNLDRFDAIMGTKYMRKHRISLDFEHNLIRIKGQKAPTLSAMQETAEVERRNAARHLVKPE